MTAKGEENCGDLGSTNGGEEFHRGVRKNARWKLIMEELAQRWKGAA